MVLNQVSKSDFLTLIRYSVLILVSLSLSLVSRLLVSLTLLIKWWLATITTINGRLRTRRLKTNRRIYMLIS